MISDHKSLIRILKIIALLARNPYGVSVKGIAERHGIELRSVYRYIETLKEVGFEIEQPARGKYKIVRSETGTDYPHEILNFHPDEASLLRQLLSGVSKKNSLKNGLLSKLELLSDETGQAAVHLIHTETAKIIEALTEAKRTKRQVLLHNYRSASSGTIKNRTVEPVKIQPGYGMLTAFDADCKENRLFKISRIERVEILKTEFQYEAEHRLLKQDVFGLSGGKETQIELALTLRGYNLLIEEFPEAREKIAKSGKKQFPYTYSDTVNGTKGAGRFIMGLPQDVQVLKPDSLKTEIKEKAKKLREIYL